MHRHTEHWINRQKNSMQLNAVAYRGSKQIQDFGMNKFYIITNNEKDKNIIIAGRQKIEKDRQFKQNYRIIK